MTSPSFKKVFQSSSFTQHYLQDNYERLGIVKSKETAYENCYSVIYYIKMGNHFFDDGSKSSLAIQPVLLFYGLCHWLKAAVLTVDPTYPANSQVLSHGLSTRKRKKKGYYFLQDEVRIQKEGLFPFLSEKLFHVKQFSGEKLSMRQLMYGISELEDLLEQLFPKKIHPPTQHNVLNKNEILKTLSATSNNELPQILTYYALLYQLSMICRYETEWWGELLYSFSSNDLPLIEQFLSISTDKCPILLENFFFPKEI
ncbi:YaaC family protein [Salipaludibacillus sp. CF4.18]|uniref:YaaC family protein n=1 Tax=Salipaludibacillus sp. CF4.18 TaxID=3373081 RepID=UPI003EE6D7C3